MADEPVKPFDLEPEPPEGEPAAENRPAPPKPRPAIDAKPLIELSEDDRCPSCGASLAHDAVVCIACGYDLRSSERRAPEVGEETVEDEPDGDVQPFIAPGRGGERVLTGVGLAIALGALALAGVVNREATAGIIIANVLLAAYLIALHTGTGVVAVVVTARILDERPRLLGLVAARMLVAFGLFYLVSLAPVPLGAFGVALKWAIAGAVYWLAVWFLFNATRGAASLIGICHFLLFAALSLGGQLAAWARGG